MILLICFVLYAPAQTEKHKLLVAGSGDLWWQGSGDKKSNQDVRRFLLNISPMAAYFVINNLAVGGRYSFGISTVRNYNTNRNRYEATTVFTSVVGPVMKYYVGKKMLKGFMMAHAAYTVQTTLRRGGVTNKDGFNTGGSAGLAYFFNPHVALETGAFLTASGFKGDWPATRGGISVGFAILLDTKSRNAALINLPEQNLP
ncbi:MAG: hypothetical protein NZM35_00690 [Chitinophagales bacterium]|nr:hypothetical protein [Chitinophagales bacterium]MDW8418361.1 hypothetical protein [Chitinophagales bacterium]